nr:hypothetical protein CFP56_31724 [Quercus suber]
MDTPVLSTDLSTDWSRMPALDASYTHARSIDFIYIFRPSGLRVEGPSTAAQLRTSEWRSTVRWSMRWAHSRGPRKKRMKGEGEKGGHDEAVEWKSAESAAQRELGLHEGQRLTI